jgi:hypothetical protein
MSFVAAHCKRALIAEAAVTSLALALQPTSLLAAPICRQIVLTGDLRAGDAFAQEIGAGLVLKLRPEVLAKPAAGESEGPDGWYLTLEPAADEPQRGVHDYIYPVNPPLRFNGRQDIGTSYGILAKEKLGYPSIAIASF